MATERTRCAKCSRQFSRVLGTRRKNCERCSPPRTRTAAVVALPGAAATAAANASDAAPVGVLASVEATLRNREVMDTWEAAAALDLARSIDAGGHSGSQLRALHDGLAAAMGAALKHAARVGDRLDQLADRRKAKFG